MDSRLTEAVIVHSLAIVILLTGRVSGVCYTDTLCEGDRVPAVSIEDCCVRTDDGLAYSDDSGCTVCIGELNKSCMFNSNLNESK